jgi:hypothetical protein
MLDVGEGEEVWVHWDRHITLREAWVLPAEAPTPRDLYVAYKDWDTSVKPHGPLASLAWLVQQGARIFAGPRAPSRGAESRVLLQGAQASESLEVAAIEAVQGGDSTDSDDVLRAAILERIPEDKRSSDVAGDLVRGLLRRRKAFGPLNLSECTESVEMVVIGTPKPVSFRVPVRRGAQGEAAETGLRSWVERGICEHVPWDTPAYGFVIVVPKPGGKWRVTINPAEVNRVTEKVDPVNGFMPDSMLGEAQRAGRCAYTAQLDLTEAFLTLKLGPEAQRISTFTTPIGKLRWKHGYFGWHSFPAVFQRVIMEKVVLPTMDDVPTAVLLAWIDDLVVGDNSSSSFLTTLFAVVDRIVAFGGRLSLAKCSFLRDKFDWCGVEIDTVNGRWRIAPDRVKSFGEVPLPKDREALSHVLGILRYYYFGVSDHGAQRDRIAMLQQMDVPGLVVQRHWTNAHTKAMRDAFAAVMAGEWLLVYNPRQPVWVTTDASGNHGYCVTAWQWDVASGRPLPISYFSAGWLSTQLLWTPQVKESYAARQAVCVIMPRAFPFAEVYLLGDNKNLAADAASEDHRVRRWQHDITSSGCRRRGWIKGEWNTIADYGSRSVLADASATLSEEEKFEMHLYAVVEGGEGPGDVAPPVVPGHLFLAPMAAEIARAQRDAPESERATWEGRDWSTVVLGGHTLHLFKQRLIVPMGARDIISRLLRAAHDGSSHYLGSGRTMHALAAQARVYWKGIEDDVTEYIRTCFKCAMAKGPHGESRTGTLQPTLAPHIHHTWYTDLKGPLPHSTGYILVVVEAISRYVKLRYLPNNTGKEVNEELLEAIVSFGTRPHVLRSDGGPPFNSAEVTEFLAAEGVQLVLGVPEHSEGQGKVETLIRQVASAIIATLGHKAQHQWKDGSLLSRLEGIINTTVCESTGSTPYGVLMGREPRTALSAQVHWSDPRFGSAVVGVDGATLNDVSEIVAQHHASVEAAEQRAILSSSVAQAVTKRDWDAKRKSPDFKVGEHIVVLHTPPNRLLPWYRGPYKVTRLSGSDNFLHGYEVVDPTREEKGPFHVSRARRIDLSRASAEEITAHQLEEGSGVITGVTGHRQLPDGTHEFEVTWLGVDFRSWVRSEHVRAVSRVLEYCLAKGLAPPGREERWQIAGEKGQGSTRRGRGRARVVAGISVGRAGDRALSSPSEAPPLERGSEAGSGPATRRRVRFADTSYRDAEVGVFTGVFPYPRTQESP